MVKIQYSNDPAATPEVTYAYDRLGRRSQTTQNGITTSLGYNDANQALSESYSGGLLNGLSVHWTRNSSLQRDSLSLGGVSGYSATFTYDSAGRLGTVSQGGSVATYGYVDHSLLVGQITYAHNGATRMTTSKEYDTLNRLRSVGSVSSGPALSDGYTYNRANQRRRGRRRPTVRIGFTSTTAWGR